MGNTPNGVLDMAWTIGDNAIMNFRKSDIDKEVDDYIQFSKRWREEIRKDPEKAKAFLLRTGIYIKSDTHPSGIELAPEFC